MIIHTYQMSSKVFLLVLLTYFVAINATEEKQIRSQQSIYLAHQLKMPQYLSKIRIFEEIDNLLEGLDDNFQDTFVQFYHMQRLSPAVQKEIYEKQDGIFFVLLAKMYLYKSFDQTGFPQLQEYQTQAPLLAAYFYFKVAAQKYGNPQAYYWLGLLQQFKLVPDRIIEGNLQKMERSKPQQILYKHLKWSHLFNGQSNLFIASTLKFDPASLILGHMNREPFGTSPNCSAALGFYLSVFKRNLFEPYLSKFVLDVSESLQDKLFTRKKLVTEEEQNNHQFVVDTGYFDEQTISATLEQANRFYTGSRGVERNLRKALKLYEKLSDQGNNEGKVMAGLMYFRGEGTQRDIIKAKKLFQQTQKDEVSEFMLLTIDYFEMATPNTRERALRVMKTKATSTKKSSHLMNYLIGSVALKGQIKEVNQDQAVQLLDRAAADGNPSARLLMAILFTDGFKGLKYGCNEATKYLSEDAVYHPYFTKRINMAEVALKRGKYAFAFFKYFELMFNSFHNSFGNGLYLLQMYQKQVLNLNQKSWQPKIFAQNKIYQQLRKMGVVPDVYSLLLEQYSPVGTKPFTINEINSLMVTSEDIKEGQLAYMLKKIVKRGVTFEKRGILKYYQYKLAKKEGASSQDLQNILSHLASGDSGKLFVLEARYLLGQLYHSNGIKNSSKLSPKDHRKTMGEYNRAVKSQLLGKLIFEIEQYKLTGMFDFTFSQSNMGQDFLTYIFFLAIVSFIFYYLRSKRFDHFHKIELEKQMRRAQEEQQQNKDPDGNREKEEQELMPQKKDDPDQPIITEDPQEAAALEPQGVRIGSSEQEIN